MKAAMQLFLALAIVLAGLLPAPTAAAAPAEAAVADGRFFTEARSQPGEGFHISDEDGIPFWTAFQRLGGVPALGYPISQRFTHEGLVSQATQRAILQWQPATQRVSLVNVLDLLHDAQLDARLEACCSTPPALDARTFDAGKSPQQVIQDRLALLDGNPAIRAAYFAAADPVERYGLPTSRVTDMGNHFAIRLQRTVIQQWKVDVLWARAGTVTFANAGDLAARMGLIPSWALFPETVTPGAIAQAQAPDLGRAAAAGLASAAAEVQMSTVRVLALPAGSGTGFIFTPEGHIITASHVVAGARLFNIVLPDNRVVRAELVGRDPLTDVAVLKIQPVDLPAVRMGDSNALLRGEPVVALGYGAPTASELDINEGSVVSLGRSRPPGAPGATATFVLSDVGLVPGFSGGPLADADGRVVGMNAAVISSPRGATTGHSISVAMGTVLPVAQQLIAQGFVARVWLGVMAADVTSEMATYYNLSTERGALVIRVEPNSPAAAAGMRAGDIIIGAKGKPIYGSSDLAALVGDMTPGEMVSLEIIQLNGQRRVEQVGVSTLP